MCSSGPGQWFSGGSFCPCLVRSPLLPAAIRARLANARGHRWDPHRQVRASQVLVRVPAVPSAAPSAESSHTL